MCARFSAGAGFFLFGLSLAFFIFGCGKDGDVRLASGWESAQVRQVANAEVLPDEPAVASDEAGAAPAYDYEGWVVGWSGYEEKRHAVIYHDDHGQWIKEELLPFDSVSFLEDVAFPEADNGWAVGGFDAGPDYQALLLHRDGTGWSRVEIPELRCTNFIKVEFTDADHGWALCGYVLGNKPLAYHYSEGLWERVPEAGLLPFVKLNEMALLADDQVYISGVVPDAGGYGLLLNYSGGVLTDIMSGRPFGWFEGLHIAAPNDGYLADCGWKLSFFDPVIYHYDGVSWTEEAGIARGACVAEFARAPGGAWYGAAYNGKPLLIQKSGKAWTVMDIPPGHIGGSMSGLHDLAFPADDFGVAVGEGSGGTPWGRQGYAIRYNGAQWQRIPALMSRAESYRGVSYVTSP